jgi:hypothetical protein
MFYGIWRVSQTSGSLDNGRLGNSVDIWPLYGVFPRFYGGGNNTRRNVTLSEKCHRS